MSNNDPQAEEMKEYFERAQQYLSEELNIEKLLQVVEEAAGIEIDPTSEANMILGRMWEAVASSVVVKGVRIEKQEDTAKIYDAADVYVKKAIACYERFVSTHPDSAEAHEALGSAYWSQDFEKALVEYELALKYDQNNPDYKKDVAHAKNLIEQGETARDNRSSWQYISTDSFFTDLSAGKIESHVKESFNKGVSLYDEGKYEESIEYFNESLELSHKLSREYTQIWYFKGFSLGRLGRKEEAIECFEEVLSRAKDPDDLMEIHGHLGHLILFGTLGEPKYIPTKDDLSYDDLNKSGKHFKEAIEIFKELPLEKKQEFAESYEKLENKHELASSLLMQKGDDNKARELLSKAISERSDNISEEDVKDAENTSNKNPEKWIAKGLAYTVHNNEDEEAIKCFDKAIEMNPNNDVAWFQKGLVFLKLDRYVATVECYDKAIELNPNEAKYWTGKANSLVVLKKEEEAIKCYDKALELKSDSADVWYLKGRLLGIIKKYYDAIECCYKSLELEPGNSETLAYMGIMYIQMEKYEEAINCINKSIKLEPNNTKYKGYLEEAYNGLEKKQPGRCQEITGKVRLTRFGTARLFVNPHSQKKLSDSDWYKFLSVEIDFPSPIVRSAFLSANSYEQIWVALWNKEDINDSDAHTVASVDIYSDGTYKFLINEDEKKEITRKINKLESKTKHLDKDRNEKFNAAGQIAYSVYVKNKPSQPPAVTAKWDEIQDIDALIAKSKQDLNELARRKKKSGFLAKLSDTIVSTAKHGKMKLDVYNLERKKHHIITEFGSILYDSHKKGDKTLEELSSIWHNIDDIEQRIRKNEEELANLRKYV